jgi:hypothetical protein
MTEPDGHSVAEMWYWRHAETLSTVTMYVA